MDDRIKREKIFHDHAFSEGVRQRTDKYYSVSESIRLFYQKELLNNCKDRDALEYGCGPGSSAFVLAEHGALVTGIDISGVAIDQATVQAREMGLKNANFKEMDAEQLRFENKSFDLICGSGIIHHLDIGKAYAEISRTLKPEGKAVFMEPLGHNPIINLYRQLTPAMRTVDEHPLTVTDLKRAKKYFNKVDVHYFNLCNLCAVPFRNQSIFKPMLGFLTGFDKALFTVIPLLRRYAWAIVMVLSEPKEGP